MTTKANGFTLIELIVVIVLISILSAVGIGLFSSPSQYTPSLASEAWINQLRYSQRQAFLKTQLTQPLLLTISRTSEVWRFTLSQAGQFIDEFDVEHNGLSINYSNASFSNECALLSVMSFPATFRFDGYGDLVDASNNKLSSNHRFCVPSTQSKNWCLSPSGYAYGGECVP
ncbi:hypothetical protein NBRC116188_14690 [Oceaniserpentilla sp. 4NH20-0058]|uniref:pilus assembly FimT family protein n=1 Tax=Oceaniserpentilla sp. 4NH20-0058 TaxID=3127660 RepID=UPI0031025052